MHAVRGDVLDQVRLAGCLVDRVGRKGILAARVTRPIGEALTGQDSQLNEAIRTLLKNLGYAE